MKMRTNITIHPVLMRRGKQFALDHDTNLSAVLSTALKFYIDHVEKYESQHGTQPVAPYHPHFSSKNQEPIPAPEKGIKKKGRPPAQEDYEDESSLEPTVIITNPPKAVRPKTQKAAPQVVHAIRPRMGIVMARTEKQTASRY